MFSSLLNRSKSSADYLWSLTFARLMGGGPRTFPGGLNKWQWKRLHEKKAREKEKRLLDQEKQLYQARLRSQIRSKLSGGDEQNMSQDPNKYNPMSPKEHIKALADRFMKEGAEDLWNESDGPLKSPSDEQQGCVETNKPAVSINSPVEIRKFISDGRGLQNRKNGENAFNYVKSRDYSTLRDFGFGSKTGSVEPFVPHDLERKHWKFTKNESSSIDDDEDYGLSNDKVKNFVSELGNKRGGVSNGRNVSVYMKNKGFDALKQRRFRRNDTSSSDDEDDDDFDGEGARGGRRMNELGSRAALGKYDVKMTRRVPLKELDEIVSADELELIRYELGNKKTFAGNEEANDGEDPILSERRFDECGVSPLTTKALTAAGYVQMTRVQEATLSVCLDGKDAIIKAKTGTGKSAAFLF